MTRSSSPSADASCEGEADGMEEIAATEARKFLLDSDDLFEAFGG